MSRWEPDAAERLAGAALTLFAQQGFSATTVPQITAAAGLTTRSFFRHFTDKREVLFAEEARLADVAARIFAEADPAASPLQVITTGLQALFLERFAGRHDTLALRRQVIRADGALRERELRKLQVLAEVGTIGFAHRGLAPLPAAAAAQLAVAVYECALQSWLDGPPDHDIAQVVADVAEAFTDLMT